MHLHESQSKLYTTLRVPKPSFVTKKENHTTLHVTMTSYPSHKNTHYSACLAYKYFREKHTTLRVTEKRQ